MTAASMLRTVSGVNDGAHVSRHCQPNAMCRTSSRRISSISRRTAGLLALWTVALKTSMRISSAAHTRLAKMPSSEVSGSNAMRRTPCVPTAPAVGGFCGWGKYRPRRSAMSHDASAWRPSSIVRIVKKNCRSGSPALETEAQQQRRALRDSAVLTPRAPAPVHLRRQELIGRIALGVQLFPGNVRLGVPLEGLGPPPQIPDVGHRRGKRQRIALLEDVSSGSLLLAQHGSLPILVYIAPRDI